MRTDLDRMTPRALIVGLEAERLSLAAALQRDGFAVSIVSTGEDAVAAIKRRRFDAAILDEDLPGIAYGRIAHTSFSGAALRSCPSMLALSELAGVTWRDSGSPRRVQGTGAATSSLRERGPASRAS